ncbi:DNA-3-methyladenine glycosylase family protein [Stutzerimonas stutzeri]|nr:DNA-3-methyladenine glycosylase [Stutzerimonas stutzeri]MCQ4328311.1 DNA-3-methyladenine glycosylase [Stutzerimonas stutzeri]
MKLILLPYLPPWTWSQFHQHFALRLLPSVETLDSDRYSRTVRIGDRAGWISVRPLPAQACLELMLSDSLHDHAAELALRVRKMFDLDNDPAIVARHFSADPLLGPLIATSPGLRLPSAFDPFEQAVRAIVGQQVTVKAAVTITRRLVERLGNELAQTPPNEAGGLLRLFPTPQAIAGAQLDKIGMPGKRVATLQYLAAAVAEGALELHVDNGVDELVSRLCELPGIGPWTAQYIALRGFGEADAFPVADLGLLKAPMWGSGGISARELLARSQAWRPWRAYAAVHIWQNYGSAMTDPKQRQLKAVESSPVLAVGR